MFLRKAATGVSAVLLVAAIWILWFAVVIFGSIMISGLDQCTFDGCGPRGPMWQEFLVLFVLVVPPLAASIFFISRVARRF